MLAPFKAENWEDEDGNPSGGWATTMGSAIFWQNGPLGRGKERQEPNGAFVETIIAIAKQRLEFYQAAGDGRFACVENKIAIDHLRQALGILNLRTREREERQVEGTHRP